MTPAKRKSSNFVQTALLLEAMHPRKKEVHGDALFVLIIETDKKSGKQTKVKVLL
jgi:hypothetical protein